MSTPLINVGILSNQKINFELNGNFTIAASTKNLNGKFAAKISGTKIILEKNGSRFEFDKEVVIEPADYSSDFFTIRDVVIGVQFHWERKEKQSFNGILKLFVEENKITAVNIVDVESYLTSVISSEMSAKSNIELLNAHAIISRSWLLAQIEKTKFLKNQKIDYKSFQENDEEIIKWYDREEHNNYDVCADDHCQRYQGVSKIFSDSAKQAVQQTNGLVLTYEDKICDARFSKSCGGISEAFENVWEKIHYPYLVPVIDYKYEPDNFQLNFNDETKAKKWIAGSPNAFCNTTDKKILAQVLLDYDQETHDFFRWKVEYKQEQLSALISEKRKIDFGEIIDLIPIQRGPSSRLIKLKIVGTKKSLTIGKELEIRKTLSTSHLYSSAFFVEKQNIINNIPQKFILHGAGWGHGVGLCQIGAAVMSELGYRFDEILTHYYKNSNLKKLY